MKYSIRKYTVDLSKNWQKKKTNNQKKITDLEAKLKHFEKHFDKYVYDIDYKVFKQQLHAKYKEETKGIKIRRKYNWYEHCEKSTKFFLKLGKTSCNPKSNKFCHY